MGASVTGIDLAHQSVEVAIEHAVDDPSLAARLTYRATSAEHLLAEGEPLNLCGVASTLAQLSIPSRLCPE